MNFKKKIEEFFYKPKRLHYISVSAVILLFLLVSPNIFIIFDRMNKEYPFSDLDYKLKSNSSNLEVPYFSQLDDRWRYEAMIDENGVDWGTVGAYGCAMTSTAMVLKYYSKDTDPGLFNAWLNTNDGYASGALLYWGKGEEYSEGKMTYFEGLTFGDDQYQHWDRLRSEIENGYPVIVKVDKDPDTYDLDEHWVVVTGFMGGAVDEPSNYYINDPAEPVNTLLSVFYDETYNNTIFALRIYHGLLEAKPVIAVSLMVGHSGIYYVGEVITGSFVIKNKGNVPIDFEVLTIGGRDPDDQVADFTFRNWIMLNPDQSYTYNGSLTLMKPGNYHFFCAYKTPDGNWNTAVPTEPGITNVKDIFVQEEINNAPLTPFNLHQIDSEKLTNIPEGGTTNIDSVDFKAAAIDPDDDNVRIEIELRQINEPFTGVPTPETISGYYPSGVTISLSRGWLVDADYHWQCRASDINGATSNWVEFGTPGNVDFTVERLPPEPVITSSLIVDQYPPYYIGDTITSQYTITNEGSTPITFEILTIGGRDPYDQVADFSNIYGVTLNPGQPYLYQGSITLNEKGAYHFFCAYKTVSGEWNTAIPTAPGISNVLDIYVETPIQEPVILQDLEITQPKPYYLGETVAGQFTIMNNAPDSITFEILTIGGRDPDDLVADFAWITGLTLNPGEIYDYYGTLTLTKSGLYHFFCTYKELGGDWNTAIPTFPGVSNVLDIQVDIELNEAFRVGTFGVSDIDPHFIWDLQSTYISQQVCEGLYAHDLGDPNLEIIPQLALDHGTWSGDNLEYTVQLKQGVTFHDGTIFDANAVKFSFDRLRNFMSVSGGSSIKSPFESMYMFKGEPIINRIEILNPYTIKFVLNNPYAAFQGLLCYSGSYILSPSSTPFDYKLELGLSDLIGTGPFVYDGFIGDDIKFHAFDNYWRGRANFDEMLFYIYSGSYDMSRALSAHKIHFINTPSFSFFDIFRSDPEITLIDTMPSVAIQYLGMNNKLIDVNHRKAISYALDYDYIIETLMSNQAIRLRSPIPEGILYSDLSFNVPELDLPYARQIMQSMGYGVGYNLYQDAEWLDAANNHPFATFSYTYNVESWFKRNMFYLIEDNLAKLGIRVVEVPIIWEEMLKIMFELDGYTRDMLELFWMGWVPDFNDPSFINPLYTNDAIAANFGQVNDAQVQQWMEQALSETNPSIRENLYRNIQQRLIEEVFPCAWGYVPINYDAYLKDLKGFQSNPMNLVYFYPCHLESQIPRPSSLFDGMFMDYHASGNLIPFDSTSVSYSSLSEHLFHTTMMFDDQTAWYDVNKNTRTISNSGGAVYFMGGTHSMFWIHTDSNLGDYIPIVVDGDGDHQFQIYGERTYNLPGFGTIEVWELEDLTEPGGYLWFEKSTGVLIKGEVYYGGGVGFYEVELVDSNADFEIFSYPPCSSIELQQDGTEISEIDIGAFFDIYVGDCTDVFGIEQIRFSSDDEQDGLQTGEWTEWYEWDTTEADWNSETKIKRWVFTTSGMKEVWVEIKDSHGETSKTYDTINAKFPKLILTSPLEITPNTPYYIGDSLTATFKIKNNGQTIINLGILTIGGRDPDGFVIDFQWDKNVFIPPNEEYTYTGTLILPEKEGTYHFFCAYQNYYEVWNTNIDLNPGMSEGDRTKDIYVFGIKDKYPFGGILIPIGALPEGKGKIIPIHIPSMIGGSNIIREENGWYTIKEFTKSDIDWEWDAFFSSFECKRAFNVLHEETAQGAALSFAVGFLGAVVSAISGFSIKITIQKNNEGDLRAIIQLGDPASNTFMRANADVGYWGDIAADAMWIYQRDFSKFLAEAFHLEPDRYSDIPRVYYTMSVSIDPAHKTDIYISYLSLSDDGRILYTPKLYSQDYIEIQRKYELIIPYKFETIKTFSGNEYVTILESYISNDDTVKILKLISPMYLVSDNAIIFKGNSPIEVRAYDSQGKMTGVLNGVVWEELQYSFFDAETKTIIIYLSKDEYYYEIVGTGVGTYGLDFYYLNNDSTTAFNTSKLPILTNEVHYYDIDLVKLIQGEEGVSIKIDSDGDGIVEHSFSSDNELNTAEYATEVLTWPYENNALQDGFEFELETFDDTLLNSLKVSIREPGGELGLIISDEFEDLQLDYQGNNFWSLTEPFDTTALPDGYYVLFVQVSDMLGFNDTTIFSFSIRNWAVLDLLPATQSNNPGRTMPVKFSLRVVEAVDPDMPFVVNEELCIVIYDIAKPNKILQTSYFGDSSKDYRIDLLGEKYITNFKTSKVPATYVVEIWRGDMLIGSFTFITQKKTGNPLLVTQLITEVPPNTITLFLVLSICLIGIVTIKAKRKKKRN